MELKLNIYNGKNIEKTYTSDNYQLSTGVCEDIIKLVDIDKLGGGINDDKVAFEVMKIVVKAFDKFKPLLKDIFEGLTDDEYSRTRVKEVGNVVIGVITYTISELFSVSEVSEKN